MAQLLSGIFANMWRCKWTTTGIYAGSTTVQVNAYGTGELEPQLARCLIKRAPSKIQRDEARAGSGPLSSCRDSLPSRGGAECSIHRRAGGQMVRLPWRQVREGTPYEKGDRGPQRAIS